MNVLDLPLRIVLTGWLFRRISSRVHTIGVEVHTPEQMYKDQRNAIESISEGVLRGNHRREFMRVFENYLYTVLLEYMFKQKQIADTMPPVNVVTIPRGDKK